MNTQFLRKEQLIALRLKAIFLSYGFKEYKLSGFEDYSLYSENKSFLAGKDIITFGAGGSLKALRPDVTLSVIKNAQTEGGTQKLFYDEKVYRKNAQGGFSELSQIGAEVIGEVDAACEAELVLLMLKTLAAAGESFVLDISHSAVTQTVLDKMNLTGKDRAFALSCLGRKAAHDFAAFAGSCAVDKKYADAFLTLITLPSDLEKALAALKKLPNEARPFVNELQSLLKLVPVGNINLDFSAGGDERYYNGLVFKGYIKSAPSAVLYGGRYDRLVSRLGKRAQAAGFALYLGELALSFCDEPVCPDVALVYKNEGAAKALELAEKLRGDGKRVLIAREIPRGFSGQIIYAEDCDA